MENNSNGYIDGASLIWIRSKTAPLVYKVNKIVCIYDVIKIIISANERHIFYQLLAIKQNLLIKHETSMG